MEKAQDSLTLSQVSNVKSVEVCADGIFETNSNQHECRPLSRPAPEVDSVSETVEDKNDSPAAAEISEAPLGDLSATEALETSTPAVAATPKDQILEPQASSADEGGALVDSESASPSSSREAELVSTEEPATNLSLASTTSSYSAFDDADDPSKPSSATAVTVHEAEETLLKVQTFLINKVQENQLSSHAQEIHEFVTQHLSDKQRKLHFPALIQRIVVHFSDDAHARGLEDVSVDVQSSICLLEQTFLILGRVSPLQDMYTAEEENMLDQLGVAVLSSRASEEGSQPLIDA